MSDRQQTPTSSFLSQIETASVGADRNNQGGSSISQPSADQSATDTRARRINKQLGRILIRLFSKKKWPPKRLAAHFKLKQQNVTSYLNRHGQYVHARRAKRK